eukprot:5318610-Pyramimonas_sp.AAC.2
MKVGAAAGPAPEIPNPTPTAVYRCRYVLQTIGSAIEYHTAFLHFHGSIKSTACMTVVKTTTTPIGQTVEVDVAICGGTLGIFVATALSVRGIKTVIVERGVVAGRAQEWNISRKELQEIIEIGVLTAEEVEEVCKAPSASSSTPTDAASTAGVLPYAFDHLPTHLYLLLWATLLSDPEIDTRALGVGQPEAVFRNR